VAGPPPGGLWFGAGYGRTMTDNDASERGLRELDEVLDDLDALLKNNDVGSALATRGVNISLALTAVAGLRSYVRGQKMDALADFETVAEEIAARAARAE
jgi:glutathione S-transferase